MPRVVNSLNPKRVERTSQTRPCASFSVVSNSRSGIRYPEIWYDFCDEQGLPCSFTSANCPFGQMEARFLGNDVYWQTKEQSDCAMVDAYGHHPSIFLWYVSNEFWIINDRRAYDLIAPSVKALRAKDPTRFVETGSDLDCRGLTQILSTHYPVAGCTFDPATWYPDMFYWRPIGRDFTVGAGVPVGQTKTGRRTSRS